jgi:hypothetical protein
MFKREDVTLRQSTNGVTQAAGVAATESVILDYVQPQNTGFKIRPGDTISLSLKSTTPTEISVTSAVRLIQTDAMGRGTNVVAEGDYGMFNATFTDRNNLYVVTKGVSIGPGQHLKLLVTADLAISTSYTRVAIKGELGYDTLN